MDMFGPGPWLPRRPDSAASASSSAPPRPNAAVQSLPPELAALPPFFQEVLRELTKHKRELGGVRNFQDHPEIRGKLTADDLKAGFTDYEYVFLQVVGFARLHQQLAEIEAKNNGKGHGENPATQLLERHCGMTMHGERPGAAGVLRSAAPCLLEAFQVSRATREGALGFFRSAFDRTADPCLEGRVSRLLEYLERHRRCTASPSAAPWEDVSLRPLPESATPRDIVGEHLRVFMGECTYQWARAKGLTYEQGKEALQKPQHAAEFERSHFNRAKFAEALLSKGVVTDGQVEWSCCSRTGDKWIPYDAKVTAQINAAVKRGAPNVDVQVKVKERWMSYQIDLRKMCQRNSKTGKEHTIRRSGTAWAVQMGQGDEWTPYDEAVTHVIEGAYQNRLASVQVSVGPKSWRYDIDLRRNVQRNPETGREREVRRVVHKPSDMKGKVDPAQAEEAIKYFVDLCTLPEPPEG